MEIIRDIAAMKEFVDAAKKAGKRIGFVPTMGYLHEGHLTLMQEAKQACDVVVASIFVNPLQFGQGEDYEEYPRDLTRDAAMAESVGVDVVFAPAVKEMYPRGYASYVDVEGITNRLCGASRPGHFRGVTTVVSKLFHIVEPDLAFFGQKDAQQVAVLKRMVEDLNMNLTIIVVPIVREHDGLALSSRNVFLNAAERSAALILSQSLAAAKQRLEQGERDATHIRAIISEMISTEPLANIDYISVSDFSSLEEIEGQITGATLIALAVRFGKTRLIDNIIWEG